VMTTTYLYYINNKERGNIVCCSTISSTVMEKTNSNEKNERILNVFKVYYHGWWVFTVPNGTNTMTDSMWDRPILYYPQLYALMLCLRSCETCHFRTIFDYFELELN
jgi:hypothetical protein